MTQRKTIIMHGAINIRPNTHWADMHVEDCDILLLVPELSPATQWEFMELACHYGCTFTNVTITGCRLGTHGGVAMEQARQTLLKLAGLSNDKPT